MPAEVGIAKITVAEIAAGVRATAVVRTVAARSRRGQQVNTPVLAPITLRVIEPVTARTAQSNRPT